ncbi:PP2C family protein-serine/threonine phosphatase [Gemmatimonadota bacterium]
MQSDHRVRTPRISVIVLLTVLLGTACSRPTMEEQAGSPELFSSESDQWEHLPSTDAQIGSEPPSSLHAMEAGEWRPLDELLDRDIESLAGLWVRTSVPPVVPDGPHLLISATSGTFAMYVDDVLVYQHGDFLVDGPVLEPHSLYHIITIPSGLKGQFLYIWRPHPISGSLDYLDMRLTSGSDIPLIIGELRRLDQVREDLTDLLFGILFLAVGLVMASFSPFRFRNQGKALLLLGLAGMMYGTRLLAELPTIRLLIEWPVLTWRYLAVFITYLIPVPMLLWFRATVGEGWRSSVLIFIRIQVVYAAAAVLLGVVTGYPERAMVLNSYLVLAFMVVIVVALRQAEMHRRKSLYIIGGFLILSIINENLVGVDLVPWEFEFEALGFFVGFCGLVFFAVRRYFRDQHEFHALEIELNTARKIQESILPAAIPVVPGADIAVRYVPMAEVAGDFYDFMVVDGSKLGVMIADVSGHGVPAALIASMVKVAFESQEPEAQEPARVLTGMNKTFCGNLEGQFVTVGYLFLDMSGPAVTYAGAGHPPVLVQRGGTGEISEFGENGLLMAGFPEAEYINTQLDLHSGDRLVLFTDGLTEASDLRDEQFGSTRLREFMAANRSLGAARFADALIDHLVEYSGRDSMEDDLTLIIVDIT